MFFKLTYGKEVHIYNPKDNPSLSGLKAYVQTAFKTLPETFHFSYLDEENDQITLSNEEDFKILRQSNSKVVKILIKEAQFQFFDQTAQVKLDAEVQKLAEQVSSKETQQKEEFVNLIEEIKAPEKQEKVEQKSEEKKEVLSAIQVASFQIQNKLKQLMPQLIGKVKEDLVRQSSVRSSVECEEKKQVQAEKQKIIHQVTCNECNIRNFEGFRYKCPICDNYNICQECEKTSQHPHPFLKIKYPEQANILIRGSCHDNCHNFLECNGKKIVNNVKNFANGLFGSNKFKEIKQEVQKKKEIFPKKNSCKQFDELGYPDNIIASQIGEKHEQNKEPTAEQLRQQKIMRNASYISEILNISYNSCYKFSQKNPTLSQEQLLELYFKDTTQVV